MPDSVSHLVIPDTQVKPGGATRHLDWIGQYIVARLKPGIQLKVIHLGDHWDMPSLSSYDRGKGAMEGRRYQLDIKAGAEALDHIVGPYWDLPATERRKYPEPQWHFLLGNHEDRITRAAENDVQLDGLITLDHVIEPAQAAGFTVHDYLKVVDIDGVRYSHYFYNPMTGRPYSGANIEPRLKTIGHSFTQGHQQTFQYGQRYLADGTAVHGLVAGACYLHEEDYKGPQGNAHWRGVVVCHQVERGDYDIMKVGLDYLCRRYEGKRLQRYLGHRL